MALSSVVWLFSEHRELYQEVERLRRVVDDLERQLAMKPAEVTGDFLNELSDKILQDLPFPNNVIPDDYWLTPGENERVARAE